MKASSAHYLFEEVFLVAGFHGLAGVCYSQNNVTWYEVAVYCLLVLCLWCVLEQSFVGLFHVCILVFYLVAVVMPVVGLKCVCVMVYWK